MLRYFLILWCTYNLFLRQNNTTKAFLTVHNMSDCLANTLNNTIYCRGSRAIRNIINNLSKSNKPITLMRGLEIVPIQDTDALQFESDNRLTNNTIAAVEDDTLFGLVSSYLRTHELNLKLSDLLDNESEQLLAHNLQHNGVEIEGAVTAGIEEARKKDKGQGMLLAMGLMFGKMLAVLGLGGIGGLALKALGVATTALFLTALVGLKSLAMHGNESSHSVSYLTSEAHHHRRRRRRSLKSNPTIYDPLHLVYKRWQSQKY